MPSGAWHISVNCSAGQNMDTRWLSYHNIADISQKVPLDHNQLVEPKFRNNKTSVWHCHILYCKKGQSTSNTPVHIISKQQHVKYSQWKNCIIIYSSLNDKRVLQKLRLLIYHSEIQKSTIKNKVNLLPYTVTKHPSFQYTELHFANEL